MIVTTPYPEIKDDPAWRLVCVWDRIAFFTDAPLESLQGEDWSSQPYDCNAEKPAWDRDDYYLLGYYGPFDEPTETAAYRFPYHGLSMRDMLTGSLPWLTFQIFDDITDTIYAGATIAEFAAFVQRHGGLVLAVPAEAA